MRVSKREKLTFVALWALGALLVAQVMGCSPSLQTNTGEETTQEEGEKRIGKDLTEWEKVALAKYLTVERPKNSIFESVSIKSTWDPIF